MKGILKAAALAAILAGASSWAADAALLSDDFKSYAKGSDGSPKWKVETGTASVTDDGYLVKNSGTDAFSVSGASTGDSSWTDYSLSFKVKLVSNGSDWRDGVWIGVRRADSENLYTVSFYASGIFIHKAANGEGSGDDNPVGKLEDQNYSLRDGAWHDVKITVAGSSISVSMDGKEALKAEDKEGVLKSGGIALGARKYGESSADCAALFKDVKVEKAGK